MLLECRPVLECSVQHGLAVVKEPNLEELSEMMPDVLAVFAEEGREGGADNHVVRNEPQGVVESNELISIDAANKGRENALDVVRASHGQRSDVGRVNGVV